MQQWRLITAGTFSLHYCPANWECMIVRIKQELAVHLQINTVVTLQDNCYTNNSQQKKIKINVKLWK